MLTTPSLEVPEPAIWLFLLAVFAFIVTGFATGMLLLGRRVSPVALVAGPLLCVIGTWLMSQVTVDASALASMDALERTVVGFGVTLVAGPLFALPTFAVATVGLAFAGLRRRPWDRIAPSIIAILGFGMVILVGFGASENSANPPFAYVRSVTYLLATVLVAIASLEAPGEAEDDSAPRGAAAVAALLPVLWVGLAEAASWGFAHVFMPSQPRTFEAATCLQDWPAAVDWMLGHLEAELPYARAAFGLALVVAGIGAYRALRFERDIVYGVVVLVSIACAAGLWGSAQLDPDYLLGLSGLCPRT